MCSRRSSRTDAPPRPSAHPEHVSDLLTVPCGGQGRSTNQGGGSPSSRQSLRAARVSMGSGRSTSCWASPHVTFPYARLRFRTTIHGLQTRFGVMNIWFTNNVCDVSVGKRWDLQRRWLRPSSMRLMSRVLTRVCCPPQQLHDPHLLLGVGYEGTKIRVSASMRNKIVARDPFAAAGVCAWTSRNAHAFV